MLICEILAFPVSIGSFNAKLIRYFFPWQKKICLVFAKFLRFCKDCVSTASIVTAARLSPTECIVFPANYLPSIINIRSHHEESLNLLPLTSSCQCLGVATLSGHESSYFLTIQPHSLGMLYVVSSDFIHVYRTLMKKCQRSAGFIVASGLTGVSSFRVISLLKFLL